jgi:hypothetical protein
MADKQTNVGVAAITLPAGSFDLQALEKAVGAAVKGANAEQHPELVNKAIVDTIALPEILASEVGVAVPTGASLVESEIVYAEGQEPQKVQSIVFNPVEAKDGTEAATMRYEERAGEVVATNEPPAAPPVTGKDADVDGAKK